jgi:hypothetical protein
MWRTGNIVIGLMSLALFIPLNVQAKGTCVVKDECCSCYLLMNRLRVRGTNWD